MSRTIGFRAWDNANNEWLNKEDAECLTIHLDGRYEIDRGWVKVFPDLTIEQDTGLKDKNGKKIWVGDIVEYDWYILSGKPAYRVKEQVVFDDMGARVGNDRIRNCSNVEVIGNVHENKELLGDEE